MKRKLFSVIIIITAIALSGIIITQFYWVKDALNTKNEQFYQNAHLGLKRVVNQIMSLQNDSATAVKLLNLSDEQNYHIKFINSLDTNLISRMIKNEFDNLELCNVFYFGIYKKGTRDFIMINNPKYESQIFNSEHNAQISCVFQKQKFMLAVYFPLEKPFIYSSMQVYIILSAIFMIIVIIGFWLTAGSLLRQKKLSEMKTDFVNNMTHEFKTPISTISFTSEILKKENIRSNPDKVNNYAEIIYAETQRLKNQVDQVLQVAILDRKDYSLKFAEIDVHEIITELTDRFELTVEERGGKILKRLNAAEHTVFADRYHITNILTNLLDNANKYSLQSPEITVSTHSNRKGLYITIDDQGIGIAESDRDDIFKKFHRVSTGDLHDVKGFGIGLYYVKAMVDAHEGKIEVKSKQGKGSTFTVWLPYKKAYKKQLLG